MRARSSSSSVTARNVEVFALVVGVGTRLLRLVDIGVLLEGLDVLLLGLVGLHFLGGDLAQRHDGVLVAVAIDQRLGAA
ncbi:MAG: hypothetical protein WDM81_03680 [Rhizomicrobium sp.]